MKHLKTIYVMYLLIIGITSNTVAQAQRGNSKTTTEWRDGDYIVRRTVITDTEPHSAEYEIHYAINSANTVANFEHNGDELARLDNFFKQLKQDTLRHVSTIAITGYASPDGTTTFNSKLAHQRAQQLSSMIAKRYGLQGYNITITSHVEPWSATTEAIEDSKLNNRSDLVRIVNANETPMKVDNRLKQEDIAWEWLTTDVLPDMRRSVVTITYTDDKIMDRREYCPIADTPSEVVIVEEITDKDKHHKHHHKDNMHKSKDHHKRNVVILNEWEGIVIDLGAATEGESTDGYNR